MYLAIVCAYLKATHGYGLSYMYIYIYMCIHVYGACMAETDAGVLKISEFQNIFVSMKYVKMHPENSQILLPVR